MTEQIVLLPDFIRGVCSGSRANSLCGAESGAHPRVREDAEGVGIHTIRIEAPEGRSLPLLLAPQLRQALLRLSQIEAAKEFAVRGLRALAGFAGMLKVTYADIEVGFDYQPESSRPDIKRDYRRRIH